MEGMIHPVALECPVKFSLNPLFFWKSFYSIVLAQGVSSHCLTGWLLEEIEGGDCQKESACSLKVWLLGLQCAQYRVVSSLFQGPRMDCPSSAVWGNARGLEFLSVREMLKRARGVEGEANSISLNRMNRNTH